MRSNNTACNVIKYIVTALFLVWIAVSTAFSARIGDYLQSFSPWIHEGDAVIEYYSEDSGTRYTLEPGEELFLPVHLEKRLSRIGVYVGSQANSPAEYAFQLEDKYGSILGKTVMRLEDMTEDQFVYIRSRSVISSTDEYYVRIFSNASASEPLELNVSPASAFQTVAFSVGDEESGYTLVLDKRYEASSKIPLILVDAVFAVIVAAFWIAGILRRPSVRRLLDAAWQEVKKFPWKKIDLALIALLVAVNIVLLFARRTEHIIQCGSGGSQELTETVIPLQADTVLEQALRFDEGEADSFSLCFATYTQQIRGGVIHVELWDDGADELVFEQNVKTETLEDNAYRYFSIGDSLQLDGRMFRLSLRAQYASDDVNAAVYVNGNSDDETPLTVNGEARDQSLLFSFTKQARVYRAGVSLLVNGILIAALMAYVWNFIPFKKKVFRSLVCAGLLSVLCFAPVMSFVTYREVSLNGMKACLQDGSAWSKQYRFSEDELEEALCRELEYDMSGEPLMMWDQTELPVWGGLSDISLRFRGDEMRRKDYDIQVYWDTGKGYNEDQSYIYKYIHQGGNQVSFPIPCSEPVNSIMINVGMPSDRFLGTALPDHIFPMTDVQINTVHQAAGEQITKDVLVFLGVFVFISAAYLWKYFELDEKLAAFFARKKITISHVFVVMAMLLGVSMSFLIPTFQVPDEPGHINAVYAALGDSATGGAVYDALNDQGLIENVIRNAGQTVDRSGYLEAASRKLEDYSFSSQGMPTFRVLRCPGATIGVTVGKLLHLPAYWILQLGELSQLAVYIALGALTLKLIPYKKNLMMLIMLLPVAMQEAGSLSYDSFTDALSFLTIAYILHLKVDAERVGWKQVWTLALLGAGLLGKGIYVFLLGLVFSIPLRKLELQLKGEESICINEEWIKRHRLLVIVFLAAGLCVCGVGSLLLAERIMSFEFKGQLLGYISNFPQLIRLCVTTCIVHSSLWLRGMVAAMGNFDVPVNDLITWTGITSVFVFAIMHHRKTAAVTLTEQRLEDSRFSGWDLFVWYGVFGVLFVIVLMTMIFWGFFIYGIDDSLPYGVKMRLLPRIEGTQGRYFYPILPLLFIPMHPRKDVLRFIPAGFYKICYYLLMTVYPISLLLVRYWGIGSW